MQYTKNLFEYCTRAIIVILLVMGVILLVLCISLLVSYLVLWGYSMSKGVVTGVSSVSNINFWEEISKNTGSIATLVTAVATVILGVVAIFQDRIRRLIIKPELDIEIDVTPPDCHKTEFKNMQTGVKTCDCYYFRFKIWNRGNDRAENVETIVTKLYKKKVDGGYKEESDFLPLNLVWSYYNTPVMANICPDTFKHCDMGYLINTNDLARLHGITKTFSSKIIFIFGIAVKPNKLSFIKEPGEYAFEVIISSANVSKSIKTYFELIVKDSWFDDEKKMLDETVCIRKINKIR